MKTTLAIAALFAASPALAAENAPHLDGATLGLFWVAPFAGILLSIALLPLVAPAFWHHHYGKVAALWALAFLAPFTLSYGADLATYEILHTLLLEYLPFIILLFTLFTVAGGVGITGRLVGTPLLNSALLLFGTLIASLMGTTGACMLLIGPVLKANRWRRKKAHVVIFFIFLVGNIGGSLTPLGDPPLFLGFLKGVDFFWTLNHLLPETAVSVALLLALFFALDTWYYTHDKGKEPPHDGESFGIEGGVNLILLAGVVGAVLLSGFWEAGAAFTVHGVTVGLAGLARDILLLLLAGLSLLLTPVRRRTHHGFSWGPIVEVAKLFAGIFATIIPAIAILRAGTSGAMAPLVRLVTTADGRPVDSMYFWLTGGLSSFLDNAPTYLVFFNLAGGDPERLMTDYASTLAAISAGAVFMGANTYIGNAPNFMVKAVAEHRGVKMPGFFGYMLWSGAILLPLFALLTVLFFR